MNYRDIKVLLVLLSIMFVGLIAHALFTPEKAAASNYHKVDICHKGKTINVDYHSVGFHLSHGDYRGTCKPVDTCESEEGVQENGCTPKDYCDTLDGVHGEDEDCPSH